MNNSSTTKNRKGLKFFLKFLITLFIWSLGAIQVVFAEEKNTDTADYHKYFAYRSFPLNQLKDGFEGNLTLLLDKKLEGLSSGEMGSNSSEGNPAQLHLLDLNENVLDAVTIVDEVGKPTYADVIEKKLSGDKRSAYILKRIETGDHGSSVTVTNFLQVNSGKLEFVTAIDSKTEKASPIELVSGGGMDVSDWRFARIDGSKSLDILCWDASLLIKVDPTRDINQTETQYDWYHFNGKKWVCYHREEKFTVLEILWNKVKHGLGLSQVDLSLTFPAVSLFAKLR